MKKTFIKKSAALTVTAAMVMSVGACSLFDKAPEQVKEAAENVAEAIASCETDDLIELTANIKSKQEAKLTDEFVFEDETKQAVVDAIKDTISYELDEESVTGSTKDGKGSADVTFTMVDWEAVYDDEENASDLDTFVAALGDSDETKEVALTLEFKLEDDEWLLSNVDDVQDVYEFVNFEVSFAPAYADLISSTEWWNSDNGSYNNATLLEFDILPTDTEIVWNFYFEIYNNNGTNLIYTSDMLTDSGMYIESYFYNTDADLDLVDDIYIPADTYKIIVYDADGNEITSSTTTVTASAPETTATTTSGSSTGMTGGISLFDNAAAEAFYDTIEGMAWYDNENDEPVSDGVFSASSFTTLEMTIKLPDDQTNYPISYRYYYSADGDINNTVLVDAGDITPIQYPGGVFIDIDYTPAVLETGVYFLVAAGDSSAFDADNLADISDANVYFLAMAIVTE